jgi:hypothetical protein
LGLYPADDEEPAQPEDDEDEENSAHDNRVDGAQVGEAGNICSAADQLVKFVTTVVSQPASKQNYVYTHEFFCCSVGVCFDEPPSPGPQHITRGGWCLSPLYGK